nr:ubiquitin conjugation factor E4 A [Onthophagus taurus]
MSNPFAALFGENSRSSTDSTRANVICDTIETVFGFTLNRSRAIERNLLYMSDLSVSFNTEVITLEILEHALFERLLIDDFEQYLIGNEKDKYETKVFIYLFRCYNNNLDVKDSSVQEVIKMLILRNVLTSLKQPELYHVQNVFAQLYDIMRNAEPNSEVFFQDVYQAALKDEDGFEGMKEAYIAFLKRIHVDIAKSTLMSFNFSVFNILMLYTNHEHLALTLLEYSKPRIEKTGAEYANTLLGALFCVSILPKTGHSEFEYFQNPLDQPSTTAQEGALQSNMATITQHIHSFFLNLLKRSPNVKSGTLQWLGDCLKSNADRGKIWASQAADFPNPTAFNNVSDGYMLNMLMVIIRLCQPFCSPGNEAKILKVDPTYCAVEEEHCATKGVHLTNLSKETCLVPIETENSQEVQHRLTASSYNFVTECFFLGHKAFDLGFRVVVDKLVKLNQEMVRIERLYNEAVNQSHGTNETMDVIKERMKTEMQKFFSIKTTLSEPTLVDMLFYFTSATSMWFNQVAVNNNFEEHYAPLKEVQLKFPLPEPIPDTLKCIPEFVVENVVCFLVFLRRFNPKIFEIQGYGRMKPILTFILIYMSSPERMKNPHMRARLAEALEALLPFHKDEPVGLNTLGGFQRELLFKTHEHRQQIVGSLLEVFVGIEMTGQSVQFEQKFNYRRPMYLVMDYLWELPEHQSYFRQLAEYAEKNMDAVTPPLFLRFVNLLMNDAVFLLDEALANMAKLKELQAARETGEWNSLSAMERSQNMGYLHHIGMIARFDNILGKDTIRTLVNLTSKITIVFTHSTMVDRIAAMLNYFLLKLVGPNQKNFKVRDNKEYSFEPAATVLDICKIYVHLKESEAFCLAVSQDGRSYSPQLFKQTEDVLVRIGGGVLVGELQDVAAKVAKKSAEYQANEDLVAEAPEHFLDPIMSTLMTDPVILPSSKQIVDRTTIARHLLSDQTDPFNRSPLTLDQVIPNKELQQEITQWVNERKAGTSS